MSQQITPEELQQLSTFQQIFSDLANRYGSIHFQQKMLQTEADQINDAFEKLEIQRAQFTQSLTEKYGQGTVDISTGEFNPESTT